MVGTQLKTSKEHQQLADGLFELTEGNLSGNVGEICNVLSENLSEKDKVKVGSGDF